MIESLANFARENTIELAKIDDHARRRVDLAGNGDIADVAVSVIILTRAQSEGAKILLFRPVRSAISMRRSERHATSQERRHVLKLGSICVASSFGTKATKDPSTPR